MVMRYAFGAAAAVVCAMSVGVVGATQSAGAPTKAGATTLQGCLTRAQDIPGRSPNVANPAGVADGFILMERRDGMERTDGAVGTTGTAGTATTATQNLGALYKVMGISSESLTALVGKRVEVRGTVNRDAATSKDADSDPHETARGNTNPVGPGSQTQTGTDANAGRGDEKDHWMEVYATAIHEVPGACPLVK